MFVVARGRYINCWNKRVQHMSLSWQAHACLKSTGKRWNLQLKCRMFFAILHDKLLNRESKMCGTVRAKALVRRWFNILECPARTHFYTAQFRLNYSWVCNNVNFESVFTAINNTKSKEHRPKINVTLYGEIFNNILKSEVLLFWKGLYHCKIMGWSSGFLEITALWRAHAFEMNYICSCKTNDKNKTPHQS